MNKNQVETSLVRRPHFLRPAQCKTVGRQDLNRRAEPRRIIELGKQAWERLKNS